MTSRLVYSSDKGRVCAACGWPADDCHCARSLKAPVPGLQARGFTVKG